MEAITRASAPAALTRRFCWRASSTACSSVSGPSTLGSGWAPAPAAKSSSVTVTSAVNALSMTRMPTLPWLMSHPRHPGLVLVPRRLRGGRLLQHPGHRLLRRCVGGGRFRPGDVQDACAGVEPVLAPCDDALVAHEAPDDLDPLGSLE